MTIPFPLLFNLIDTQSNEMITLAKQMVHAHWLILEDYPPRDGEYVVAFETDDGSYGWLDIWEFTAVDGWVPILDFAAHTQQPVFWCNLPMPK